VETIRFRRGQNAPQGHCPLEEADAIEHEGDDDHRHEGDRGVPHDVPHPGHIREVHNPEEQGHNGASRCRPANGKALGWAITKVKVTAKIATATAVRLVPVRLTTGAFRLL